MGRDKATLPWGDPPQPLWELQIEKLDALDLSEILISARADQDFGSCEVVIDATPGAGPLPALAGCLEQARSPYLLPLAVDMPAMTTSFLLQLLEKSGPHGLVFRHGKFFEPFPGLYPRSLLPLLGECLASRKDSLQQFLTAATEPNLLDTAPLLESDSDLFKSVNTPEDI